MNPSSIRSGFLTAALTASIAALLSHSGMAQVTTDPVGFVNVALAGNSDSYTYIPFKRTPEYAGALASPNGVSGNTLTAAGSPNFGNLVYTPPSQPKKYYILFTSGSKNGLFYSITGNTASTLTVATAGDDLSTVSGSNFQVIPYDTLGSLFPNGQGVNGSPSHSSSQRQTEILIPDNITAGTNLAAAKSYYYYSGASGAGPGWRLAGVPGTIVNDDVLYPDTPFIARQNTATSSQVTFMGTVHMGRLATPIGTITSNTDQDNAVALPIASNMTLSQSQLFQSGAFVGSPSHSSATRKDELLVWDNAFGGTNKAADRSYYYYTGTSGNGPGWRLAGDVSTIRDNDIVFTSTTSVTVRKKTAGAASTSLWAVTPPYVP